VKALRPKSMQLPDTGTSRLHGAMSYLLQDDDGQVVEAPISAGLDYPGVGRSIVI